MSYNLRPYVLTAEVDPHLPFHRLGEIADQLDLHADTAPKHGRVLVAEKASSRAAELRELAGVAR